MTSTNRKNSSAFLRAYERGMLRSAFVSLFWNIIQAKKKTSGLTLQELAKSVRANKSEVSRWFRSDPNWTVNTIANLAEGLDVDLEIRARDRVTGVVYTSSGVETAVSVSAYSDTAGTDVVSKFKSDAFANAVFQSWISDADRHVVETWPANDSYAPHKHTALARA